jgi:hypothetical protein
MDARGVMAIRRKQVTKRKPVDELSKITDRQTAKLLALAGICTGGPPDLADRHDEFLGMEFRKLF